MMKYLQRLGKSLMLPVACLPVAAILQGIGYWIDPTGWGANNVIAAFLLKGGGCLIDQMPILFAIGVAVGMSDDNDGTAGLAGLVSWIMTTTLLSTSVVSMLTKTAVEEVDPAFAKTQTQFIGILCGLIAAACYNKFKNTKLPDAFSFFSGKRCVAIVTAGASLVSSFVLFFVWPMVYNALVALGEFIMNLGPVGAGIYGFFNRLLIPFGLHHALNSVFWFDVAGINDIAKFWGNAEGGVPWTDWYVHVRFLPGYDVRSSGSSSCYVPHSKRHKEKSGSRSSSFRSYRFFLQRCYRASGILFHVPCTSTLRYPCSTDRYFYGSCSYASCESRIQLQCRFH